MTTEEEHRGPCRLTDKDGAVEGVSAAGLFPETLLMCDQMIVHWWRG